MLLGFIMPQYRNGQSNRVKGKRRPCFRVPTQKAPKDKGRNGRNVCLFVVSLRRDANDMVELGTETDEPCASDQQGR